MRQIETHAGEFVIPLSYEIHIGIEHGLQSPQAVSPYGQKVLLGRAWALFWENFVDSICHPDLARHMSRMPKPDIESGQNLAAPDIDINDIGEAFLLSPGALEQLSQTNIADAKKVRDLLRFFESGTAPSSDFSDRISRSPIKIPGERFADGVGYAFNENGEKELGIVFSAELLDFYAEEGSLSATGTAVLKFFGTTLLVPLITLAISPPAISYMEKLASIYRIEKQLSMQDVRCNITAEFHFARKELIMKLEHKLSVGGRAGICEIQSALMALGFSPGRVDGIGGANTQAAEIAFATAWGLSPHNIGSPVFFNLLARALMGERPPYK